MKKNYILLTFMLFAVFYSVKAQVIITELADPNNSAGSRYVELYVLDSSVDFTGWELVRYTNANANLSSNIVDLSSLGTLTEGSFAIIAANGTTFQDTYGTSADISAGTGGPADSNGDDKIAVRNNMGTIIDIFGTPETNSNNTETEMNFEDGRAERKASVTSSNATWDASEWNTDNDQGFGSGPQDAPEGFDPKEWIGATSTPTISVSSSTIENIDYFFGNGPSSEQSFTVDGINLTTDITVTAPANFEISLTSGSSFTGSISLSPTDGSVASTTVYLRLASGLAVNTYSGDISISSAGTDNKTIAVSGEVSPADPQFFFSAFLDEFNYTSGNGPSAEQDFEVEGLFLVDDLMISVPEEFEVSLTSGSGFASSVSITPNSGTLEETTVYIRLKAGIAKGKYSGDVILMSNTVENKTFTVNGRVFGELTNSLVITGVYDGSLTGGTPKGVELYVLKDIADLSVYGVSSVTNGQGSTAGDVEFTLGDESAKAGDFIYVSTEDTNFNTFFGMMPNYTTGSVAINGDDSIELYENGQIIDVFGDVDSDGTGTEWDYLDGWAYRNSNTGPEGTTFTVTNWTYSDVNGLEGGTNNETATSPFPLGTYNNTTASIRDNQIDGFATYPNPVANNQLTVKSNSVVKKDISVFNLLGKKIFSTSFTGIKSTIDVSSISSGLYILKVTEGKKVATSKLMIK